MHDLLKHAASYASKRTDKRTFLIGAIAIRSDGAMVKARNESTQIPTPAAHAESRVSGKAKAGAVIYVARALKNGKLAMARPCSHCMTCLKNRRISKVYYTISESEYGVIDFVTGRELTYGEYSNE